MMMMMMMIFLGHYHWLTCPARIPINLLRGTPPPPPNNSCFCMLQAFASEVESSYFEALLSMLGAWKRHALVWVSFWRYPFLKGPKPENLNTKPKQFGHTAAGKKVLQQQTKPFLFFGSIFVDLLVAQVYMVPRHPTL